MVSLSSETLPDPESSQLEDSRANTWTSAHPVSGYDRGRTMAPPPEWTARSTHGLHLNDGPSTQQSAMDHINESIEKSEGTAVNPPPYTENQSRAHTMAPDPEYANELQAEAEDHVEAEEIPWYMV